MRPSRMPGSPRPPPPPGHQNHVTCKDTVSGKFVVAVSGDPHLAASNQVDDEPECLAHASMSPPPSSGPALHGRWANQYSAVQPSTRKAVQPVGLSRPAGPLNNGSSVISIKPSGVSGTSPAAAIDRRAPSPCRDGLRRERTWARATEHPAADGPASAVPRYPIQPRRRTKKSGFNGRWGRRGTRCTAGPRAPARS